MEREKSRTIGKPRIQPYDADVLPQSFYAPPAQQVEISSKQHAYGIWETLNDFCQIAHVHYQKGYPDALEAVTVPDTAGHHRVGSVLVEASTHGHYEDDVPLSRTQCAYWMRNTGTDKVATEAAEILSKVHGQYHGRFLILIRSWSYGTTRSAAISGYSVPIRQ